MSFRGHCGVKSPVPLLLAHRWFNIPVFSPVIIFPLHIKPEAAPNSCRGKPSNFPPSFPPCSHFFPIPFLPHDALPGLMHSSYDQDEDETTVCAEVWKIQITSFSAGKLFRRPRDCAQLLLNGEKTSGLYKIYVGGEDGQSLQVYCDMTTDGGGWLVRETPPAGHLCMIVICSNTITEPVAHYSSELFVKLLWLIKLKTSQIFLRRQNGKLEFYRNWKNYTAGFGNMNDEFWLGKETSLFFFKVLYFMSLLSLLTQVCDIWVTGLSNLHKITSSGHYELRVDLRDQGDLAYAQYDKFTIAEPRTRYKLYIGGYSGTAGGLVHISKGRGHQPYWNWELLPEYGGNMKSHLFDTDSLQQCDNN